MLRLELYTPEELGQIVTRSAGILGVPIEAAGAAELPGGPEAPPDCQPPSPAGAGFCPGPGWAA